LRILEEAEQLGRGTSRDVQGQGHERDEEIQDRRIIGKTHPSLSRKYWQRHLVC